MNEEIKLDPQFDLAMRLTGTLMEVCNAANARQDTVICAVLALISAAIRAIPCRDCQVYAVQRIREQFDQFAARDLAAEALDGRGTSANGSVHHHHHAS